MNTLVDLVDMIGKPEGVHKINTIEIVFRIISTALLSTRTCSGVNYSSAEYRVTAIILDIANYRLFRPVRSDFPAEKPKHFMKIKF